MRISTLAVAAMLVGAPLAAEAQIPIPGPTVQTIKAAGNYGELYDEFFGPKALDLARGQNKLWTNGGLQYSLPFR